MSNNLGFVDPDAIVEGAVDLIDCDQFLQQTELCEAYHNIQDSVKESTPTQIHFCVKDTLSFMRFHEIGKGYSGCPQTLVEVKIKEFVPRKWIVLTLTYSYQNSLNTERHNTAKLDFETECVKIRKHINDRNSFCGNTIELVYMIRYLQEGKKIFRIYSHKLYLLFKKFLEENNVKFKDGTTLNDPDCFEIDIVDDAFV